MPRLRVFSITIAIAILLLSLKIGDLWQSAGRALGPGAAIAAEHDKTAAAGQTAEISAEDELEPQPGTALVDRLETPDVVDVSPTEIRMLEDLLGRRTRLDRWQRDIEMRENLLAATEARIDEKIAMLKGINENIEGVIKQFNIREDEKITSLVKIYETMKPKDAARIFNELDLDILIEVLRRMKETRAALVIAKMSSEKAKVITMELAVRNSLPDVDADALVTGNN